MYKRLLGYNEFGCYCDKILCILKGFLKDFIMCMLNMCRFMLNCYYCYLFINIMF